MIANINYQTEKFSENYYWGYGLRDSLSYSYGYSNYFNPSSQHYSGINYARINDRQSAGAGKSTYTESRDKTSGTNGRYAFCYMGM